ncbi:hypothetical protein CCP1ISM_450006 [Azospirillaceae bacterium]
MTYSKDELKAMDVNKLVDLGIIARVCSKEWDGKTNPFTFFSDRGMIQTIPINLDRLTIEAKEKHPDDLKKQIGYIMVSSGGRADPNTVKERLTK